MLQKQDIKVGQKFKTRGKFPRECEVIDILKTYNLSGDLVKTEYLCQHEFMGQMLKHTECAVTIQRGAIMEGIN